MRILSNGQVLMITDEKIDSQVLDLYPNLKVIGCNMTGLDHINLNECESRKVKVISLKGQRKFLDTVTSTSEHTVGLIISLLRNYRQALNAPYDDRDKYMGHTLKGKTLGLIGFGRVGKQVYRAAEGLGMKVLAIDKETIIERVFKFILKESYFDHVLSQSDIVSVHIPLQGNEGFFTYKMFQHMKPTAYFINTSRSKVVEQGTLIKALEYGTIKGAAVDFIDEPELREYASEHDNLILTNHIGGVTFEDREKTLSFITEKVDNYMQQFFKINNEGD